MRLKLPAALLICLGVVLIAASVLTGEAKVGLVVIIPVIYGGGVLLLCGVLCVMSGIMLFFFSASGNDAAEDEAGESGNVEMRTEKRAGGVLLIGPVPIIFGTDKKMALVAAAIALIAMALIIMMLL